ncbi:uncharacterized acetyltransferase At3g50280-like [Neltuma alba]|uniref:uncharacterized acetyltransferase At3g50280-like n=1 Tax=Neltuma alba TaxID=207710 RepID=UPI0010A392B9|nr:uncharacterized acetyltransferase At3g50280-like [Prosopis alba]
MAAVRTISTTTIRARSGLNHGDSPQQIDLNPWDLQFLLLEYAQKGLLFRKPASSSSSSILGETVIQQLKDSLSSTLDFFLPLAGRFLVVSHGGNTTVADIVEPTYVPPIVSSFFPSSNVKNFEAVRVPLVAVQVTQLADGVFVACSMNHCLADVKPYWNFLNAWAQISRNGLNHIAPNSKLASFERWFPHGDIHRPIAISSKKIIENHLEEPINLIQPSPPFSRRIFHFKREKIAEMKAKANSEVNDSVNSNKISSLQAIVALVWRSVIRNQNLDPEEEVTYRFLISAGSRVSHPPIPEDYFGITVQLAVVTMKVRDLVGDRGFGKFASEMNRAVSSFTEEKIKSDFEAWIRNPIMRLQRATIGKCMGTSSSPRVNFYDIDFGWGKPVAVRGGPANAKLWKLAADAGLEEDSFDIELCASYEILEALARDIEFMHAMESSLPAKLSTTREVARTRL